MKVKERLMRWIDSAVDRLDAMPGRWLLLLLATCALFGLLVGVAIAADTATDTPVNPDSGPRLIMPRLSSKAALWEAASRRRSPYDKINQLTLASSSSVENSPCSVHSGQGSVVRSQRDAQSLWLSLVQHCCQTAKSRTRVRQRRYVSSAGSMASNSIGLSKSRSGGPGSPGGPAAPSPP